MNVQGPTDQDLERITKNIGDLLPHLAQDVEDFACGRLIVKHDPSEKLAHYERLYVDQDFLRQEITNWLNGLPMLIASGHSDEAIQALENGSDPNAKSAPSYLQIADFMIPDILRSHNEYPPLHVAAIIKDANVFNALLDHGANPFLGIVKDTQHQRAPIASETCAKYGFTDGLIALEKRGHDLWPFSEEMPENLLADAIGEYGTVECFDYLYDALNITDINFTFQGDKHIADGCTLMTLGKHFTPLEIVESMLKKGAELNVEANRKDLRIVEGTAEFKQDMDDQYGSGFSNAFTAATTLGQLYDTLPIIHAAYHGKLERVQLYLQYGADPTIRDHNGHTALDAVRDSRRPSFQQKDTHKQIERILLKAIEDKMGANVTLFTPAKPDLDIEG